MALAIGIDEWLNGGGGGGGGGGAVGANGSASAGSMNTSTGGAEGMSQVDVVAYIYLLPAICITGIVGNVANLLTLASPRLRAVSYFYLRALAVADLFCMCFVLIFVSWQIGAYNDMAVFGTYWMAFYRAHFMLSLINWTISAGVLVVVALTVERFISVRFPIYFRSWNSPRRATLAVTLAYAIPLLLYTPYARWRYHIVSEQNGTVFGGTDNTDVIELPLWQVYKWTREGLLRFAPIVTLAVLNAQIIVAFRKRRRLRERLNASRHSASVQSSRAGAQSTARQPGAQTGGGGQRDDALLYLLGGIAIMFFVCNVPAAINLLFINEAIKTQPYYRVFRAAANLLEITNHALNFFVFCLCSSDYRTALVERFPCVGRLRKDSMRALRGPSWMRRLRPGGSEVPAEESTSELTALRSRATKLTTQEDDASAPASLQISRRGYDSTRATPLNRPVIKVTSESDTAIHPQAADKGAVTAVTLLDFNGDIRFITDDDVIL